MPRIKAVTLLCVLLTTPAAAEIYRWKDASGVIHFSDIPPRHEHHSRVQVPDPVTIPMSDTVRQSENVRQSRRAVGKLLQPERKNRYAQADKTAAAQAARCEKHRQQLDRIQSQLRAGYSNDRGNRLRERRRNLSQRYSRECVLR
ncbi:MAG: DUF4124 domain-containing protein [Marinobacter sp.]|uniref:Glycolate oxidase iron-sulfur subunit n=2 Tax=Marinobacteraceae TaxID=2887365 RepID=A0A2G1UMP1_9GAMM|nr:DUF4124 domain-containing protein [Marinobacter sp.]PHQ15705.1 glycolate oxidase iron-sulfur subunit [Marinobacter profundi]